MRRILSGALLFLLLVQFCPPVLAANVYLCEGFGSYQTNTYELEGYDTVGDVQVVEEKSEKCLLLHHDTYSQISKKFENPLEGSFIFSFDLKGGKHRVCMDVGLSSATEKYLLLKVDENALKLSDGKQVGTLTGDRFTKVAVGYNALSGRITVWIDGKIKAGNWAMSSSSSSYSGIYMRHAAQCGDVYIDNLAVYEGTAIDDSIKDLRYTDEKMENLHIEQDVGDYTYFHSMCISNRAGAYIYTKLSPKTNNIICERYDYQNPEKGDRILFEKTTEDDCFIDITTTKRQADNKYDKNYQYFMLTTEFLLTDASLEGQMFLIRDNTSGAVRSEFQTSVYNGNMLSADGKALSSNIAMNQWYRYTVYLNLAEHTMDIYLNDTLVGEAIPIPSTINQIDMVRLSVRKGKGELQVRNWEVTGLEKPVVDGQVTRTSVFPENRIMAEYLDTKIAAFHYNSQVLYKDGEKSPLMERAEYDKKELYVSLPDLNRALGRCYTIEEIKEFIQVQGEKIPVLALAQAMGLYTFHDENGMIILNDEPILLDEEWKPHWYDTYYEAVVNTGSYMGYYEELTDAQQLNYFLLYDRPTAQQLEEVFEQRTNGGTQHPRLLVNQEGIERIKEQAKSDEYLQSLIDNAIALADKAMEEAVSVYAFNDDMRTLGNSENFENRVKKLGFAYLLTGEEKYAQRAYQDLEAVAEFPDFNFSHVIDTGAWNQGMAFGYDWIYQWMNQEQREKIAGALVELGVKPINRAYYAGMPSNGTAGTGSGGGIQATNAFVRWKSNYGCFVNSGVICAALAVAETDPQLCFDTLEKALRSYEYVLLGIAPDGAWMESTSYWYTMLTDMAYSLGSLVTVMGDDYKLLEAPGMENQCRILASYSSPNSKLSYGDDGPSTEVYLSFDSFSFFSYYYGQEDIAMWRKIRLDPQLRKKYGNRMRAADPSMLDVVFYMPNPSEDSIKELPNVSVVKGMESFAVHEDYTDPNALFFVSAGGPTTFYHEHNDGGDFMFDLDGESWTYIIGKSTYNAGSAETRYSSRAEAHNTLTINPDEKFSQVAGSFAELVRHEENEHGAYAVYDMTQLYPAADSLYRGFYIGDDYSTITVRDEMHFNTDSNGYWFMSTEAEPTILDENTVILTKNGKSLVMQIEAEAENYTLSVMNAEPLPSSPKVEGDNTYPNVKKVAIYFEGKDVTLTVRMGTFGGVVDTHTH